MIWSLAMCSNDAKQDPAVYGTEFGVLLIVVLAKGPRNTTSIPEGLRCLGLFHLGLEGERHF